MSDRRVFADFAPSPWPELAWADTLTQEEAAEFTVDRDACPAIMGLTGCCSAGVCVLDGGHRVVTLGDCYRCVSENRHPKIGRLDTDVVEIQRS